VPVVRTKRATGQTHLHNVEEFSVAAVNFDFAVTEQVIGAADPGCDLVAPSEVNRGETNRIVGWLGFFVEAMTLTRRRQDLAPLIERTVERLHAEGLRAYAAEMAARGWQTRLDPETSARRFWAIAIGVTLEGQAMGRAPEALAAEMLRLLGPQADASPGTARLKLVGAQNFQPDTSPAGKEKQP